MAVDFLYLVEYGSLCFQHYPTHDLLTQGLTHPSYSLEVLILFVTDPLCSGLFSFDFVLMRFFSLFFFYLLHSILCNNVILILFDLMWLRVA